MDDDASFAGFFRLFIRVLGFVEDNIWLILFLFPTGVQPPSNIGDLGGLVDVLVGPGGGGKCWGIVPGWSRSPSWSLAQASGWSSS